MWSRFFRSWPGVTRGHDSADAPSRVPAAEPPRVSCFATVRHRVLSKWSLRFSTFLGGVPPQAGRGASPQFPQGLVAPSVSLPMVGCHLSQGGRRRTHRATRSVSPPLGRSTGRRPGRGVKPWSRAKLLPPVSPPIGGSTAEGGEGGFLGGSPDRREGRGVKPWSRANLLPAQGVLFRDSATPGVGEVAFPFLPLLGGVPQQPPPSAAPPLPPPPRGEETGGRTAS